MRVSDCVAAISFYTRVFGAKEDFRLVEPGTGRVGHAELNFGGTVLMMSDPFPEMDFLAPDQSPGAPRATVSIHLHVDDADAMIAKAVAEGATLLREPSDAFYGERSGTVRCPFGHEWMIGHSIEEVTPATNTGEIIAAKNSAIMTSADMTGFLADVAGPGSLQAVRMAVADFGGSC